jgi:prophage regulatory protein
MGERLVTESDLPIKVSKAQRNKLIRKGQFPRPIYPTPRKPAWLQSDIDAWLKAKIADRDAA